MIQAYSLRAIVEKHRRHVELSPGVGKDAHSYGLAVCDDILADLPASLISEAPSCEHHGVMVPNDEQGTAWHCAVCSSISEAQTDEEGMATHEQGDFVRRPSDPIKPPAPPSEAIRVLAEDVPRTEPEPSGMTDLRPWVQHKTGCFTCLHCHFGSDKSGHDNQHAMGYGACENYESVGCTCGLDAALSQEPSRPEITSEQILKLVCGRCGHYWETHCEGQCSGWMAGGVAFTTATCPCTDFVPRGSQGPLRWQPTDADLCIIHRCVADYAHEVHGIIYPVWVSEAQELLKRMPLPTSPVISEGEPQIGDPL